MVLARCALVPPVLLCTLEVVMVSDGLSVFLLICKVADSADPFK